MWELFNAVAKLPLSKQDLIRRAYSSAWQLICLAVSECIKPDGLTEKGRALVAELRAAVERMK